MPISISDLLPWDSLKTQSFTGKNKGYFDNPPFTVSNTLNNKIVLWEGPIWQLQVDAIVNSTNETLTDSYGVSKQIMAAAGETLRYECATTEGCRTGEAISTDGHDLPAKRIIHTVAPKFSTKYQLAAENALHCCYRQCLSVLKEEGLDTIAFCCVSQKRKNYPPTEAAHIAIRTVRRFLEHFGTGIERVVFCTDNVEEYCLYEAILPMYFPRSSTELSYSLANLPENIGNQYGEPVKEERKIRILPSLPASAPQNEPEASPAALPAKKCDMLFASMAENPDDEKLKRLTKALPTKYHHYLERATREV